MPCPSGTTKRYANEYNSRVQKSRPTSAALSRTALVPEELSQALLQALSQACYRRCYYVVCSGKDRELNKTAYAVCYSSMQMA